MEDHAAKDGERATMEKQKKVYEQQDEQELAEIGFFYLQWASGKSCSCVDLDRAAPLAKKYFGVTSTELFFGGNVPEGFGK